MSYQDEIQHLKRHHETQMDHWWQLYQEGKIGQKEYFDRTAEIGWLYQDARQDIEDQYNGVPKDVEPDQY